MLPHVEGFVHHQQAQPVAELEQFRRGRIVAGADGVDAQPFHDLELPFGGAAVDGRAQRAQVVVHADALQLEVPAVQQRSPWSLSNSMVRMPNGVT